MTGIQLRKRSYPPAAFHAARQAGYTLLQARIIAARMPFLAGDRAKLAVHPPLAALDAPASLPDIEAAVARLGVAIVQGEHLVCLADHDVDGSTAASIVYTALTQFLGLPPSRVHLFASHRLREGYGVSDAMLDRILKEVPRPAVMITVDQGSADGLRITRLRAEGIDTVVTDHHEIPSTGIPADAVAVVNPTREDSLFPDPSVAGCYVAFLVMCALREALIAAGELAADAPRLTSLLDYAAVGTVADCVDLATSANNRAVVLHGLKLINARARPCWRALGRYLNAPITSELLGWTLGPLLNSAGRIDNSLAAVQFLLAPDDVIADQLLARLAELNTVRRAVQDEMLTRSKALAAEQVSSGASAIVIHDPQGHPGAHGVVAGRLAEAFARPTVYLSPKSGVPGVLTGSLRSVEGVHLKQALDRCNAVEPGSLLGGGGHAAAAGCSVSQDRVEAFKRAFNAAVAEQCATHNLQRTIETEGEPPRDPDLDMVGEIHALAPFGRQFPAPVFEGRFRVQAIRAVGDGRHLKMSLQSASGAPLQGIWFNALDAADQLWPVANGESATFAYTLATNTFRGKTTVDMHIASARKEIAP